MARRESLSTPAGTISFLLPTDARVAALSQRWPFQLSALSERDDPHNLRAEFFLPLSDATAVMAGVYMPQMPAQRREDALAVLELGRRALAHTLARLAAQGELRGVVLAAAACREEEGAWVPGLALFFVPAPEDARHEPPPLAADVDVTLQPGCGHMLDRALAALGTARPGGERIPPAVGLKVASASYMGRVWLDFALVAGELFCLQEQIDAAHPLWAELAQAGGLEVVHMPVRGSTPELARGEPAPGGPGPGPGGPGPGPGPGADASEEGEVSHDSGVLPPGAVSPNGVRRIYRVLYHLAACDGEVHPREREVLRAFCDCFGIADDELGRLEAEAAASERLSVGGNPAERALLLDAMLDVAAADGRLAREEEKRLVVFAELLGVPREALRRAVLARFTPAQREAAAREERPTPRGLRRIYRLLWNLAACDGEIARGEVTLLEGFRVRHGISREEARDLAEEGRAGKNLEVGKDETEREMLVSELIELAAADGVLSPPERRRILKLGRLLDLGTDELERRLAARFPAGNAVVPPPAAPSSVGAGADPSPAPAADLAALADGRVVLLEVGEGIVSVNLLQLPYAERGFRGVPPGVHRFAVTTPRGEASCWVKVEPGQVVVRGLTGDQMLPVDPELARHVAAQAAAGELDEKLRAFPIHLPWQRLTAPLRRVSFPPELHQPASGHRLSRLEHAWQRTHQGDGRALLAELAWSFLRSLLEDDAPAHERWTHLVQAVYHAGERLPQDDPGLFLRLVDLLIEQQRQLPREHFAENSVLVFGSHYLSEDLIDTGVPELIEAGRRWSVFVAGNHRGAPPAGHLPDELLHPPELPAGHPFAVALAETAAELAQVEAAHGPQDERLLPLLAQRGALQEAAGDPLGALATQLRQLEVGEATGALSQDLASGLRRLSRLYRLTGQGPAADDADARANALLLQSYEQN
ncbi:MAG: TerB family tellurite resistance protein [Planctomycetota bacterium]